MNKKINKIIDNNIILKNLYKNKNVCDKELNEFLKKLENIKIIHQNFSGESPNLEILLLHYLIEKGLKLHNKDDIDVSKIKVKKEFKINTNNNNLEIGDIVELSDNVNNEKLLGIYIGEYPSNYKIYCENEYLVIEYNEFQYMFYSPVKKKIFSSLEVFYKRIDKKKQEKIQKELDKLFKI